jgi:hypothetical protein
MGEPTEELEFLTDGEWTARELLVLIDNVSIIYNSFKALNDPSFLNQYTFEESGDMILTTRRKLRRLEESLDDEGKLRIARIQMSSPGEIIFKGTKREINETEKIIANSKHMKRIETPPVNQDALNRAVRETTKGLPRRMENIVIDALEFILTLEDRQKLIAVPSPEEKYKR